MRYVIGVDPAFGPSQSVTTVWEMGLDGVLWGDSNVIDVQYEVLDDDPKALMPADAAALREAQMEREKAER